MSLSKLPDLEALFDVSLPPSPYPGLRPFRKDEWPIFFGRERMVEDVTKLLLDRRFVAIHGDSGCGKSSLVKAGILPRLEQEHARDGTLWRTTETQPLDAPIHNLASALACFETPEPGEQQVSEYHRILNLGRAAAPVLAERLGPGADCCFCILIDQFEELFAFARRHPGMEASLYIDVLTGLYERAPEGIHVVLTMRSEFLGACAGYSGLAEIVNATQYLLPPMTRSALIRAVQEPALLYDGTVATDLAERLVSDAGAGQDHLPLIQHALMLLHRRKAGGEVARRAELPPWSLTLNDYRDTEGVAELLSAHADDVLEEASRAHESGAEIVESVFRALTDIDAGGHAVRNPQTMGKLAAIAGADLDILNRLLKPLRVDGVSFVRPYGDNDLREDDLVDISHEALIRCWSKISSPKGSGWLQKEFEDGLIWKSLMVQAKSFAEKSQQVLSPATTLERIAWVGKRNREWAERYGGGWDAVQTLLTASRANRRRQRLIKAGLGLATLGLLIGVVLTFVYKFESEKHQELANKLAEEKHKVEQERDEVLRQNRIREATTNQAQKTIADLNAQNEALAAQLDQASEDLNLAIDKNAQISNALEQARKDATSGAELEVELEQVQINLAQAQRALSAQQEQAKTAQIKTSKSTVPRPQMVAIPPGCFQMGSNLRIDPYARADEQPTRQVCIKQPFSMGVFEVTFEEYDPFAVETGRELPDDQGWGRGRRPAINVSWEDARDYAMWLSSKTGKRYRLPTEAEWEYAARAGKQTPWSFGDNEKVVERYAWFDGNSGQSTHPVGTREPNPWGLHDVHGNVWEWVPGWSA